MGKFKVGDFAPEELAIVSQVHGDFLPITGEKPSRELVKVTEKIIREFPTTTFINIHNDETPQSGLHSDCPPKEA